MKVITAILESNTVHYRLHTNQILDEKVFPLSPTTQDLIETYKGLWILVQELWIFKGNSVSLVKHPKKAIGNCNCLQINVSNMFCSGCVGNIGLLMFVV